MMITQSLIDGLSSWSGKNVRGSYLHIYNPAINKVIYTRQEFLVQGVTSNSGYQTVTLPTLMTDADFSVSFEGQDVVATSGPLAFAVLSMNTTSTVYVRTLRTTDAAPVAFKAKMVATWQLKDF